MCARVCVCVRERVSRVVGGDAILLSVSLKGELVGGRR